MKWWKLFLAIVVTAVISAAGYLGMALEAAILSRLVQR